MAVDNLGSIVISQTIRYLAAKPMKLTAIEAKLGVATQSSMRATSKINYQTVSFFHEEFTMLDRPIYAGAILTVNTKNKRCYLLDTPIFSLA